MRTISLDPGNWKTELDFYNALLAAVGAPDWHGRNLNALIDSMIWGGINAVGPPYTIKILQAEELPTDVRREIEIVRQAFIKARKEFRARRGHDVEVYLELAP